MGPGRDQKVVENSISRLHLLQNNIPTTPPPKWMNTIGITPEEWNFFNGIVRNTQEVKLNDFQFKINDNILVTTSFLYKINKTDNDRCSYCDQNSISHLFYHYDKAKDFWSALKN